MNELSIGLHETPETLDPQKVGNQVSSTVVFLLFKGLTRLEADRTINCDLADSFQISEDCKTYTFFLGNHYWSNGAPITAEDFVYSWRRALRLDFPSKTLHFFRHIRNAMKAKQGIVPLEQIGVHAKGEKILEVSLEHPCHYFLELTAFCFLFPVYRFADEDRIFDVCSGPFILQRSTSNRQMVLKKNLLCKNTAPVHLDSIRFQVIPDGKRRFALFEQGKLDWMGDPISPLPPNYLPALVKTNKVKPVSGVVCCWFNTMAHPFDNPILRNAFSLTIQRDAILKKLMRPNIFAAHWPILEALKHGPSASPKLQPGISSKMFRVALKKLQSKRKVIRLAYELREEHAQLAQVLKAHWEMVFPVSIRLIPLSLKELFGHFPKSRFDLLITGAMAQYSDKISFLERLEFQDSPRNFAAWENSRYQAILTKYRKSGDEKERQLLAGLAESILIKQAPFVPIYSYFYSYMQQPYVKNIAISPVGVVHFDRAALVKTSGASEVKESRSVNA